MSDKFKNSKFYKTMKDPKVSRVIYISLVLILIAAAVTVGIVSAAKRSKPETPNVDTTGTVNRPNTPSDTGSNAPDTNTEAPVDSSDKPSDTGVSTPTVGQVPMLSLPVSGKLIKYHDAKVQVFSETMNDYRVHLGVDIATSASSPVYAAAAGKISKIWKDPMMGYCVAITHSGDAVTIYKNLADTLPEGIAEGVSVKAGQQIASVGESAMLEVAEEPHLHLEMTVGGIQVDPLEYYSRSDLEAMAADTAYED